MKELLIEESSIEEQLLWLDQDVQHLGQLKKAVPRNIAKFLLLDHFGPFLKI